MGWQNILQLTSRADFIKNFNLKFNARIQCQERESNKKLADDMRFMTRSLETVEG